MFLDRGLSVKSASKFIGPDEVIETVITGERLQSPGDLLRDAQAAKAVGVQSLFHATAGNVFHIVITTTHIRIVSTNPSTGRPAGVVDDRDRSAGLGTLDGKGGRVLDLGGVALKLNKKNAEIAQNYATS